MQTTFKKPVTMLERTADSDVTRKPTGTFSYKTQGIDHVVVVLGRSAADKLVVVTCYPSQVGTQATIGTTTLDGEDIEEHEFGTHQVRRKVDEKDLPRLGW